MVDNFCDFLTNKIKCKMPDVDEERAEIINYGLKLIIGELPKGLAILILAWILNVFKETLLALLFILPYRSVSGGVHLKTHIGCFIATFISYVGNAFLSKNLIFPVGIKLTFIILTWIFSMFMIKLYAPADTEAVPILRKKERKTKKVLSYIIMTVNLVIAAALKNNIYSNLIIFGTIIQTITITRLMYKITKNKYGYEEYLKQEGLKNLGT